MICSLGRTLKLAQVETEKGNIPNQRLVIFDARSFAHFVNACHLPDGLCLGRCCMLLANVQLRVILGFKRPRTMALLGFICSFPSPFLLVSDSSTSPTARMTVWL